MDDARRAAFPGGRVAIGGGLGIVGLIVALLLGLNPLDSGSEATLPGVDQVVGEGTDLRQECRTGADANSKQDCRIVAFVNSVQDYWRSEFARNGGTYRVARTRLFSGGTATGCGVASSQVDQFYCPADRTVYIDLGFFDELRTRFGASGGPFAQGYVLAHEYGHHVQNLLGTMGRVAGDRAGPQSGAVRLELQADCYAGVWARQAVDTGFYTQPFTEQDIRQALDAAAAVGDDRIQQRTTGRVNPEGWTHGSAQQRVDWFANGYRTGDPNACDTFSGDI